MPEYIPTAVIEAAACVTERDLDRQWAIRLREKLAAIRSRKRAIKAACAIVAMVIAGAILWGAL